MNKAIVLFFISILSWQCNKALEEGDSSAIPTDLTTISQGSFQAGSHPTSGTVKLAKDVSGKKFLVFENFKTDPGPDIRIWIAVDKSDKDYTELSKTVFTGNFKIDVPASSDTNKQTHVLIWCKAFSVLFGSAELK